MALVLEGKCKGRGGRPPATTCNLPLATMQEIPRFWGQSPQDAHLLSSRPMTKLTLTNAYATCAGQKQGAKLVRKQKVPIDTSPPNGDLRAAKMDRKTFSRQLQLDDETFVQS